MLKIVPMTEHDYTTIGGQVTIGNIMRDGANSPRGLNSIEIFGSDSMLYGDYSRSCTRANVRAMIRLQRPVVNYCLGGPSGDMIRKILGVPQKDFRQIVEFKVVWNIIEDRLDSASNVSDYDIDEVLCHGDLIKKWIDEFEIEEAIVDEIVNIFDKHLFMKIDRTEITYKQGTVNVIGDWYYTPQLELSKNEIDDLLNSIKSSMIKSGDERIVYLVNMKNKDSLYGMLMNYITVLPPDMRPAIGNMHDQFTKKYSEVIKKNDHLELIISSGHQVKEYIFTYSALVKSVIELVYKHNQRDKNSVSIQEKLSGKYGLIRDRMLGKRDDYSGRSTIIVNPELGLDECGIPEEMMPKLFRYHLLKAEVFPNLDKMKSTPDREVADKLEKSGILKRVPVQLNRAPTLHRLSFLGFFAKRAKTKAIELHPLVCPGYNADFDGDTMAVHVPCADEAVNEVRELMLATRNLFIPANGKPTLVPRQEIVYGLNVASKDYLEKDTSKVIKYDNLEELKKSVLMHEIKVWDKVTIDGVTDTAGRQLIKWCLPKELHSKVKEITKKSIEDYIAWILPYGITQYKKTINGMVEIGFKLAKLYAPTCNILVDIRDPFLQNPFAEFHKNMESTIKLHDLGFEDEYSFQAKFNDEFDKVEKEMIKRIGSALGEDNGYLKLVNSGARGSVENLIQIYGYKGRIAKSSYESFNAIIENSFTRQLSPLEHFISAYGTRKGMIDKVQKTGDTGYAGRLMYQAASDIVIKEEDCRTDRGLKVSKADLMHYVKSEDGSKKDTEVERIFKGIIEGRYEFGTNKYITAELAAEYARLKKSVIIRSPLTCRSQCCAKCYGEDLTIRGKAVKGLAVGFIAGQSIGEPGTQLTMRTFHKGGVAGKADVTSDFDRMQAFIQCSDISKKSNYDPIAWASGKVMIKESPTKLKIQIEGSSKSKEVPKSANIKSIAIKGEGLCTIEGDHNVSEILEYAGLEAAQKYLLYSMHTTYFGKADINIKHFEVLISAMTLHAILQTDRRDLHPGLFYTNAELYKGSLGKTRMTDTIKSVKDLQTLKNDPLSTILMEDFGHGMARSIVLGLTSNHEAQMGRLMLGLKPLVGTGLNPDYIKDRKREETFYGND